ncbi:hypothetical protein LDENG_00288690 [Lucifuga dentata]|nr:hypothetical protein LDENG_00288690 [Lucifuga dentata]
MKTFEREPKLLANDKEAQSAQTSPSTSAWSSRRLCTAHLTNRAEDLPSTPPAWLYAESWVGFWWTWLNWMN